MSKRKDNRRSRMKGIGMIAELNARNRTYIHYSSVKHSSSINPVYMKNTDYQWVNGFYIGGIEEEGSFITIDKK